MDGFRIKILALLFKLFPFNLKGDLTSFEVEGDDKLISCVINFYSRGYLIEGILHSLAKQNMPKDKFEVILVEDRGGSNKGAEIIEKFLNLLRIQYYCISNNFGMMGYSRNIALSKAKGKYVLFLDDDTVILQNDFLSKLVNEFEKTGADGIIPMGMASYNLIKKKYGFHDPYFPSSRCMAYRMEVLKELQGFVSNMIGQEDVEFTIRFIASAKRYYKSKDLKFLHPPLIINNLNKAKAVGISFARLKNRYPLLVWLLLIINGARFIPKLIFPLNLKWKMQGRFSLGFLLGVIYGLLGKKIDYS